MSRTTLWAWARPLGGVLVLVVVAVRLGGGPFLDGVRAASPAAVVLALAVTAGTTWCCAARWSLLAERLDVPVGVGAAYRACYRSQLLNSVLPGGVLGDVDRAVQHGRDAGAVGRGLRSVLWDRVSGQVAQVAMTVAAAPLLPAPLDAIVLWSSLAAAGFGVVIVLLPAGVGPAVRRELRRAPAAAGVWPRVVGLSALAAGGHVVVFVVAARASGVDAPVTQLVPLALVVLVAAALPLNVAGWGPREGAAAAVFAAAGLGGAAGVEVAVTFGVLSFVATLPGLLALGGRATRPRSVTMVVSESRGEEAARV
ncbi:lysylphosphatidylglycerol synthase domain-containing protein [Nocardioides panacisoli]|uniref:Lysylphosphatidylglycerol synthase transmembrane domain-containing protein n=1 Tax=Nocardioides panacisoli TaxID=627624 RepID=A0ABP7I1B6_9ACTN